MKNRFVFHSKWYMLFMKAVFSGAKSRIYIVVLSLNISVGIVYLTTLGLSIQRDLVKVADFSVFYSTGLMIRDGHSGQIYDVDLAKRYQLQVLEEDLFEGGILPFVYPPHVALIFTPFALFTRHTAFIIWTICQLLVLFYLLRLLIKSTPTWSKREHWMMGSAIVSFLPLIFAFLTGTFALITLTCIMQIYISMKNKTDEKGGLWFTIGLIKPQLLFMPGIALLASRRWPTFIVIFLGGVVIMILSSLIQGWEIWIEYFTQAKKFTGYFGSFGFYPEMMYNFRGLLTLFLGYERGVMINNVSILGLVSSAVIIYWVWRIPVSLDNPVLELRMALTLLVGLLFNLHVYQYDALQLIVPVVLFYGYLRRTGLPRTAFTISVISFPYIFLFFWLTLDSNRFILIPVLAMFGLAIWMGKLLVFEHLSKADPILVN